MHSERFAYLFLSVPASYTHFAPNANTQGARQQTIKFRPWVLDFALTVIPISLHLINSSDFKGVTYDLGQIKLKGYQAL